MIVQRATLHPRPQAAAGALGAEMLSATEVLIYGNTSKRLDVLGAKIRATGVKSIALASGVSRSQLQPIVNEGKIPHESTIARIEGVFQSRWSIDPNTIAHFAH
jgi:hypothetical protein